MRPLRGSRGTPPRAAGGRRRGMRRPAARVAGPSRSATRRPSAGAAGRCPRTPPRARRGRSRPHAAFRRRFARARLSSRASPRRRERPRWRWLDLSGCRLPPRYDDVREQLVLHQVDDASPVEIEQRDERDDREADRGRLAEERSEAHPLLFGDELFDLGGALLHRVALTRRDHVLLALALREGEDARPRRRESVDLAATRGQLDRAALAMERALAGAKPRAKLTRALADDRVLQQPQSKLLFRLALLIVEWLEAGQEASRLQKDEARRERQGRRDLVGRPGPPRANPGEIGVGEIAEAHGEYVELLLLDELEEQIKRSVESLDRHARSLRFHHGSASRSARARSRSSLVIGRR